MAVTAHTGGDHHRPGHDLAVLTDVDVGGVQPHIGEWLVVQPPAAEHRHVVVDGFADPRHRRLADAGVTAERLDQVIDLPGGGAGDVGAHDHRPQGLVDASARLQQVGEEAAFSELGDAELDIACRGGDQLGSVAVALGGAKRGSLARFGTDLGRQLRLDQLLQGGGHDLADGGGQGGVGADQCVGEVGQGRLLMGHRAEPSRCRRHEVRTVARLLGGPAPTPRGGTHPPRFRSRMRGVEPQMESSSSAPASSAAAVTFVAAANRASVTASTSISPRSTAEMKSADRPHLAASAAFDRPAASRADVTLAPIRSR